MTDKRRANCSEMTGEQLASSVASYGLEVEGGGGRARYFRGTKMCRVGNWVVKEG